MTTYRAEIVRRIAEAKGISRPMAQTLLNQLESVGLRVDLEDRPRDERALA